MAATRTSSGCRRRATPNSAARARTLPRLRRFVYVHPVLAALVLLPVLLVTTPTASVGLAVGTEAPPFSLKVMNAAKAGRAVVALGDYVGHKAPHAKKGVLLSFAASYCAPCKKELAELQRAEPAWRAAGLLTAVVVIDTDAAGIEAMRRFLLDELALDFPVLSDRFGILARRYRAEALPYVVLIDAGGVVRWSHAGYDPAELAQVLQRL